MTDDTEPDFFKVRKPREPSEWQELATDMLDDENRLTNWETNFLEDFLSRGWRVPTFRMKAIFEKMCDEYGWDFPEDDDGH